MPANVLELDGLTKRFAGRAALDGLSFAVRPGAVLGFLGPNGAGKTTAMRVIVGVTGPDAGEVRWQGTPITASARRCFGYMPEERGLYAGMTVTDELVYLARLHGLGAADARAATAAWLERFGIAERAGEKIETLSLGNQQRVQLAAALVHGPDLLLLDEPFSGLDPVGTDAMAAVLAERATAGVSVVFSSHQLDLVEHICDEVAIIDGGRLVVSGAVDELALGGPSRLEVEVAGTGGSWADGLAGVAVEARDGDRVQLTLAGGVDPASVLDAARSAGPVLLFARRRRRLSEVFRAAVGR
jgi:ABC-2 type transport system ATP-binding protein